MIPPTVLVAAVLTVLSVALSVSVRRAHGGSGVIVTGLLGIIMLSALLVPGFSGIGAATAALALLVPTTACARRRRRQDASAWRNRESDRSEIGLQFVDVFFMAAGMFLMPAMARGADARAESVGAAPMSGMRHSLSSSSMFLMTLILWIFCVATIAVPAMRSRKKLDVRLVLHSCGMLAAMATASA